MATSEEGSLALLDRALLELMVHIDANGSRDSNERASPACLRLIGEGGPIACQQPSLQENPGRLLHEWPDAWMGHSAIFMGQSTSGRAVAVFRASHRGRQVESPLL
jgi:hypothetical protein